MMDVSVLRDAAESLKASDVLWHQALAGWLEDAASNVEPQIAVWGAAGRDTEGLMETYYRWPLAVARAVMEEVATP